MGISKNGGGKDALETQEERKANFDVYRTLKKLGAMPQSSLVKNSTSSGASSINS